MSAPKPVNPEPEKPRERGLPGVNYHRLVTEIRPEDVEYLRNLHAEAAQRIAARGSRIGALFADRTFGSYIRTVGNNAAYLAAFETAEDPETRGIGLYGAVGTGKTHLAAAIVNAGIAKNIPGMVLNVITFGIELRKTYDNKAGDESESEVLKKYIDVPVLVLDDIQGVNLKAWNVEMLYMLVNARYERRRPLIVTANMSLADLRQRRVSSDITHIWTATMDRIAEMTQHNWHKIEGSSKR